MLALGVLVLAGCSQAAQPASYEELTAPAAPEATVVAAAIAAPEATVAAAPAAQAEPKVVAEQFVRALYAGDVATLRGMYAYLRAGEKTQEAGIALNSLMVGTPTLDANLKVHDVPVNVQTSSGPFRYTVMVKEDGSVAGYMRGAGSR
jgi:hypothetical protein